MGKKKTELFTGWRLVSLVPRCHLLDKAEDLRGLEDESAGRPQVRAILLRN